ncbi:MAG: PadR family transcriptional regulator [Verrucomicrobia bacterium]|nr:MAG: PadR family transcriptional regulator [Verrucomicrobiota bacterium]PYJ96884.1 MAG: PadR family transcriptional regulator [Verrucomicrobiota bacterium]
MKSVRREILLGFWKVHILNHASEEPLHGHWMLTELRRDGYAISPGTLYPLLQGMERLGLAEEQSGPSRRASGRAVTAGSLRREKKCSCWFARKSLNSSCS